MPRWTRKVRLPKFVRGLYLSLDIPINMVQATGQRNSRVNDTGLSYQIFEKLFRRSASVSYLLDS